LKITKNKNYKFLLSIRKLHCIITMKKEGED